MVDIFSLFNPLHPNISMHILHTFIYTFLKVLTRRICLAIGSLMVLLWFLVVSSFKVVYAQTCGSTDFITATDQTNSASLIQLPAIFYVAVTGHFCRVVTGSLAAIGRLKSRNCSPFRYGSSGQPANQPFNKPKNKQFKERRGSPRGQHQDTGKKHGRKTPETERTAGEQ